MGGTKSSGSNKLPLQSESTPTPRAQHMKADAPEFVPSLAAVTSVIRPPPGLDSPEMSATDAAPQQYNPWETLDESGAKANKELEKPNRPPASITADSTFD